MFADALDSTAVWDSYADALQYAQNRELQYVPYNGQIISVKAGENAGVYKLSVDTSLTEELSDGRDHYKLESLDGTGELKEIFTLRNNEERIEKIWEFTAGLRIEETLEADNINAITLIVDKKNEQLTQALKVFISSYNYIQGGSGFGIYKSENGSWNLDIDNVQVRGGLSVNSLLVNETEYLGGEVILTVGGSIEATAVEDTDSGGYKVYFKNKDEDGREIYCNFVAGDLVKHQTFNEKSGQHFYWLQVDEVGDDYVVLSRLAGDATAYSSPSAGDKIVHLGNTTNKDRQAALIFSARTQSMRIYTGIDTTSLGNAEAPIDLNPIESKILAKFITMSTGYSLDTAFTDVSDRMGVLEDDVDVLKNQTDRQFVIWFGDYTPTLLNAPYTDWLTDDKDERDMHIKDIFYNRNTSVSAGGGRAFRFEKDVLGNYSWNEITDKDTLLALEKAAAAQDTADNKRRVFVLNENEVPTPPYDEGDMWVNATCYDAIAGTGTVVSFTNDTVAVKKGIHKLEGEKFDIGDWQPTSTATTAYLTQLSNSVLAFVKETENSISEVQNKLATAQEAADQAVRDAGTANGIANAAQKAADSALSAFQITSRNITALVGGEYLNEDGTVKENYKGIIDATYSAVSAFVQKLTFDDNGLVTNINTSGLVLTSQFASLFSTRVEADGIATRAEIATAVQDGISKAVINADQINIDGDVTMNKYFHVDKETGFLTIGNKDASGIYNKDALTVYGSGYFSGDITATSGTFSNIKSSGVNEAGEEFFKLDEDGRLTANEATIRGTIYATNGEFEGKINATSGTFNNITSTGGKFKINADGSFSGTEGTLDGVTIGTTNKIYIKSDADGNGTISDSNGTVLRFGERGFGLYSGTNVLLPNYIAMDGKNTWSTGDHQCYLFIQPHWFELFFDNSQYFRVRDGATTMVWEVKGLPTSSNDAGKNCVYLSGDTLKVRTN